MRIRVKPRQALLAGLGALLLAGGGTVPAAAGSAVVPQGRTAATAAPSAPVMAPRTAPDAAGGLPAWGQTSLRDVALEFAEDDGRGRPSSMARVATDRRRAEWLTDGALVDSDEPVYLVVMHGHFRDPHARPPLGAALPAGSTLTLTVDASSGRVTDLTLNSLAYASLDTLGPVRSIP